MLELSKKTRHSVLTAVLVCFMGISGMPAYAETPDGKTIDECVQSSYRGAALLSGIGNALVTVATANLINNAARAKVVNKDDKLERSGKSMEEAEDAVTRESYMEHYSHCMKRHPEWHMKSSVSRRDFLDESEIPALTDGAAIIIDSLEGKEEIELGESNVITATIRVHAPDRQGKKMYVKHSLVTSKGFGLGAKSIEEAPFPGEDEEILDLVDGVFTYRFDVPLPPENEKTEFMKGQEMIYEMRLYQDGKLVDRRIMPFTVTELSAADLDFDAETETDGLLPDGDAPAQ